MNINNHLTSLAQTRFQPGDACIPASKWRQLLQWNVLTPYLCLLHLLLFTSVFKTVSLTVSFQGISLTLVFFFLSFVPALKRLSLGLLFLVTYTLSSPYISDEYLTSDDYMVCIYLALWGGKEFHFSGGHWIYKSGIIILFLCFYFCLNLKINWQLVIRFSTANLALLPVVMIPPDAEQESVEQNWNKRKLLQIDNWS